MTISLAVDSLREIINRRLPDCLFFGEHHQTDVRQSSFRDFFLLAAAELRPLGFRIVFVEINHRAASDFKRLLEGGISCAEFRLRWAKPGSMTEKFKDEFFSGLRSLHDSGVEIALINQVSGPGRDNFMARRLHKKLLDGRRAVFLCGYAHAAVRPQIERSTWLSAAELTALDADATVYSVAEVSRAMLLHFDYDERLLPLFNEAACRQELLTGSALPACREYVFSRQRLGKGAQHCREFRAQTVELYFRHFNALYFDTARFMPPADEDLGNSCNWTADEADRRLR
jgi:hypothetical protein